MGNRSEHVKTWRRTTKKRIIDAFGGCCGICGYNKCDAALELHHLDPLLKDFTLGSIRANPKNWQAVAAECSKCVMLCANCHKEYHAGQIDDLKICPRFDTNFIHYREIARFQKRDNCPICNSLKNESNKTCSRSCASKLTGSIDWEKYDILDMFFVQGLTKTKIADMVGCSDVAVSKRIKKLSKISPTK